MKMNKHKADPNSENARKRKWMNKHVADPDTKSPTKGKRKQQGIDALLQNDSGEIDKLHDDLLIAILSRMRIMDAVRTSVLSRRWRYLWTFTNRTLEFDDKNISTNGTKMKNRKFNFLLYDFIKSHQAPSVDSLTIRFGDKGKSDDYTIIDSWVSFASRKEVKRFELDLSVPGGSPCNRVFPDIPALLVQFPPNKYFPLLVSSGSAACCLRYVNGFTSLRSIKLVDVAIKDEVVKYFLESCHYIENICIRGSNATKDLEFVDPLPYLKVLEISECCNIESLVISVINLVACTYQGRDIGLPFKKVPKVSELTLGGVFCESFVYEPYIHSSYSAQLVKLVLNLQTASVLRDIVPADLPQLCALKQLELSIASQVGRSLLFLTSLIKASPQLEEFKIKINYLVFCSEPSDIVLRRLMPFPEVTTVEEANVFDHKNLKVIEMSGYCGCASEAEFLVQLCKIAATSLETVIIDTDCDYYRDYPLYKVLMLVYKPREDGQVPMMKGVEKGKVIRREPARNGKMNRFDAKKHAEQLISSFFSSEIKFVVR